MVYGAIPRIINRIKINQFIFGSLLSTSAPRAQIVGSAFIALFAIVVVMVGSDYEGMNNPDLGSSKNGSKN